MIAISRAGRLLRQLPDDTASAILDAVSLAALTGQAEPLGANVWRVMVPVGRRTYCATFAMGRDGLPVIIDVHRDRSRAP